MLLPKVFEYTKNSKKIIFAVGEGKSSEDFPLWRAKTLDTKEPVTLEWIDTFQPNDIMWDVGANVGVYTLYAAIMRGVNVYSFEPESTNYAILNENIRLNNLHDRVKAYCIAVSNCKKFTTLNLGQIDPGSSGHSINSTKREPAFVQGCISYTLDSLSTLLQAPTHIKIDVDGVEPWIVEGGINMMKSVKSILIEFYDRRADHMRAKQTIESLGFTCDPLVLERTVKSLANNMQEWVSICLRVDLTI